MEVLLLIITVFPMALIHFYGDPQYPVVVQYTINTDCIPKVLHATGATDMTATCG